MTGFKPRFTITSQIALCLTRIELVRQKVGHKQLPNDLILRKKTRSDLKYYFRHLEALPPEIHKKELSGYLRALDHVTYWSKHSNTITQTRLKILHGCLFNTNRPDAYRTEQNAIFNATMKEVLYLPPSAEKVPILMRELISWLARPRKLACPIVAGIAHFGINAIHPYLDGNGRTARLVTRWILGLGGYDLHGHYCLEKYYSKDLLAYYEALSLHSAKTQAPGLMHADITPWLEYFLQGMAEVFENRVRFHNSINCKT